MRTRLDQSEGLTFLEFTYQLLQAYDFWHLYEHQGCRIQVDNLLNTLVIRKVEVTDVAWGQ